jgi:hypothetical protein
MVETAMSAQLIVQRQMEAYNRRDLDEFCSYFAPDAVTRLYENDEHLAVGIDAIRALYARRFAENPNLHLTVQARIALDNVVVDRELISGFDGGVTIEAIAIFEIQNGRIQRASFVRRATG